MFHELAVRVNALPKVIFFMFGVGSSMIIFAFYTITTSNSKQASTFSDGKATIDQYHVNRFIALVDGADVEHEAWLCYAASDYREWERSSYSGQQESPKVRLLLVGTLLPANEVNALSQGVGLIQVEKGRLYHVGRYGLIGLHRQWSWGDGAYVIDIDSDGYGRYFEIDLQKSSRFKKSFKCLLQEPTVEEKRRLRTLMRERLEEYAMSRK